MGYYGLPPGNSFQELSDLEKLLRSLPLEAAKEALDLLETLCRNIIQNPAEEKFRRVRTTNAKLAPLFGTQGALDIMYEIGFTQDGEFVVLAKDIKLDFPKHIVKILEAKSHYAKQESIKRGSAKLGRDPAKAGVLQDLERDRRERAAEKSAAPAKPDAQVASEVVRPTEVPEITQAAPTPAATQDSRDAPEAPPASAPKGWACPGCTFANSEHLAVCEMCEAPRSTGITPAAATSAPTVPPNSAEVPKSCPAFEPPARTPEKAAGPQKEMSLQELRAMQKNKYKDFQADPSAAQSDAYKKPASSINGNQEAGWFDWMWGGSSSSGGGGAPPPSGGQRQKPRMKTVADLPKPARGGG